MTLRMGDEPRISEKWDFRRQENNFDDSLSDDPDSNSTHDPIIENPNLVLHSNQLDNGTTTVTGEQALETPKRRSKKDESKPEKAKQVKRRKPKIVCAEKSRNKEETVMENKKTEETVMENKKTEETLMENKKIEETLMDNKKKEETVMETGDVGMFMKTLLDDLKASRESLMDWMSTELYGSSDQNFASRPHLKKRAAAVGVAAQRSVKKRRAKKKIEEEKESEKQSKHNEISQEMDKPIETSLEIVQNGGEQVHELDYNVGPLDMFLKSGQGGLGRNNFQQPEQGQEGTMTNQKSVVLAIKTPKLSQRQKKTREADTIVNISSMVERTLTGSETQKYDDNFAIPFVPKLSSSPSSLQSFPLGSSSLNSLFPSSSQGITSLASNNNFQPPVVSQLPDLSEFQTGFTGGQGFGNSLFRDSSSYSGFPADFQPNLIAGGYNFPAQVNPPTSSQQRDHNNVFGGLRMAGGAIRYSGNRFPEPEVGNGNNSFSDYRTGSAGR